MRIGGEDPVFIVGPSRSGTTLLAACLNGTPDLHVGAETHYFDDLRQRMRGRERAPLGPADAEACEAYFMALAHGIYGTEAARRWTAADDTPEARVERSALRSLATEIGPGSDAWFEAFCRLQAQARGKERWGEKTPRHVFRVPEILERWPAARIVCMIRDPRDVLCSYHSFARAAHRERRRTSDQWQAWAEADRRRIARSQNSALLALLWRSAARASLAAVARFGEQRISLLRYEDLVREPERSLRVLAEKLALRFDASILERVPQMNSSFAERKPNAGLSDASVARWREDLPTRDVAVTQALCRSPMARLGYEPVPVPLAALYVTRAFAELPWALLLTLHANRERIANVPAYLAQRIGLDRERRGPTP